MLTVLTWLWRQEKAVYHYTAEDVNVWASMVSRHLTLPHRLACVTDMPAGIDSAVDIIPMPDVLADLQSKHWPLKKGAPQCGRRLHMWGPDAGKWYGERFVSMDLDCVITGSLDSLLDRAEDVVLCEGRRARYPYNGSMQLIRAGSRPEVFERITQAEFELATSRYFGSDQAWIPYVLGPDEAKWTEADGVYLYSVRRFPAPVKLKRNLARGKAANPRLESDPKPPGGMKVLFCAGNHKPRELCAVYPFIRENYH